METIRDYMLKGLAPDEDERTREIIHEDGNNHDYHVQLCRCPRIFQQSHVGFGSQFWVPQYICTFFYGLGWIHLLKHEYQKAERLSFWSTA